MKKEQIKRLKELMAQYKSMQDLEEQRKAAAVFIAYLDGVLDGIKTD